MIIVIGRIQTRTWEGQDGKKNYATEVVASEVSFGESKRSSDEGSSYTPSMNTSVPEMPETQDDDFVTLETNDDLPF